MIYRLKHVDCDAMLIAESTTLNDILAFGVFYADVAGSGGFSIQVHHDAPQQVALVGDYLLRAPRLFGENHCFEVLTAEQLAERYDLVTQ